MSQEAKKPKYLGINTGDEFRSKIRGLFCIGVKATAVNSIGESKTNLLNEKWFSFR